ncbi:hypothetical protein D3C76_1508990 [compost metagenome]
MISADLRSGSAKIADMTLVVTTESSIYSPVPSLLAVDAQPTTATDSKAIAAKFLAILYRFFMISMTPT